jgi:competence protein ComEA
VFSFTRNQLIAAAVIVGFALVGTVVLVARSGVFGRSPSGEVKFIEPGAVETGKPVGADTPSKPNEICVHIAGKVAKPGVYGLPPGSRVKDAIEFAGGAVGDADLETINLAEKLTDGQQVYIAPKGKVPPPKTSIVRGGNPASIQRTAAVEAAGESAAPKKLTTPGEGMVNINRACLEELQRLPGIGPAYAQRIIDYRTEHGRFEAVEELDEVKGIGPAKLAKLRPFVTL